LRLVDAGAVDVVFCWKWDRFIREPLDLEYLIPRFDKAGVRFAEADGIIDLGTDSGRLAARILIAVAKAEAERKAERQKLANEAAAVAGKRRLGTPRPFGYREDHVTPDPVEDPAVAEACAALLGGGTVSGVMREWTAAGLRPAQARSGQWTRSSIRTILMNPRIAGLSAYRGEIVGLGDWEPLVSEETWRAVHASELPPEDQMDPGRVRHARLQKRRGNELDHIVAALPDVPAGASGLAETRMRRIVAGEALPAYCRAERLLGLAITRPTGRGVLWRRISRSRSG
jgi:hypothetical protein